MTIGSITLSTLTQRIASVNVTFLLPITWHYNSPSISIWLAVFSPSASGRCTGGIFSQSGRTHNFHHICCLAALTALKPGLIIIIMTLSPPRPLQTSPGPQVSISKHYYFWSSCYISNIYLLHGLNSTILHCCGCDKFRNRYFNVQSDCGPNMLFSLVKLWCFDIFMFN